MSKRSILFLFVLAFIIIFPVISAADDFALPPPPDANEAMVPPPPGAGGSDTLPPPPGGDSAAVSSDSALPPPPGGDTAAASTDNSMPPPPAESAAAAPAQEESQAPAEEPVKVVKSKKSGHKVAAGTSRYSVHKGDSLWRISGKDSVYGDSFKWPLLFKANRPNIDDPDLIYPRQALKVSKRFTQEEETDAVEKAKETPPFQPHSEPRKKLPIKY